MLLFFNVCTELQLSEDQLKQLTLNEIQNHLLRNNSTLSKYDGIKFNCRRMLCVTIVTILESVNTSVFSEYAFGSSRGLS